MRGHFAYFAVPTNVHRLQAFRTEVEGHWRRALRRRSQRTRLTWERMRRLSRRWHVDPHGAHPVSRGRQSRDGLGQPRLTRVREDCDPTRREPARYGLPDATRAGHDHDFFPSRRHDSRRFASP